MNRLATQDNKGDVCPYLGSHGDPETALGYPSLINHCYRALPVASVGTKYQRTYCLSASHAECRVYLKDANLPLPLIKRERRTESAQRGRSKVIPWAILFSILLIGLIIWQSLPGGIFRSASVGPPFRQTAALALAETNAQTPSSIPTLIHYTATPTLLQASPTLLPKIVPSPPTVIHSHALETPIGIDHPFIIHRITDGESLELISNAYGTTLEALRQVNYALQVPLLVGSLIIIPSQKTDVSRLPAFEAYMVKQDVSVENLARQLMVDPAVFMSYNELQKAQVLTAGEWVLVPHIATATP
jgi:hypothetical protein